MLNLVLVGFRNINPNMWEKIVYFSPNYSFLKKPKVLQPYEKLKLEGQGRKLYSGS